MSMMIKTGRRLEGIGEYYFSTKLREIESLNQAGKDIINLGIGSPDLPAHPSVVDVLREESMNPASHGYQSYRGSAVLRSAISEWYRKWYKVTLDPATEILPLIGSKEGILHICMTYLDPGDKVLVPDPGYPTYVSAVKLAGGTCIPYTLSPEKNYEPEFEKFSREELKNVKLLFVNYPHMPTGQPGNIRLFEKIVRFANDNNILVVNDNPYSFILNEDPCSILATANAASNVIELNSLSKSHNMAGWRVGMLVGNKNRIDEILRFKSNMDSGMFLPVQLAAAKALTLGKEWYDQLNMIYGTRRQLVYELLTALGCSFTTSQCGLFVWASIPASYADGYQLSDDVLHKASVFITPGGIFGKAGTGFVRVSLCNSVVRLESAVTRIKQNVWNGKK